MKIKMKFKPAVNGVVHDDVIVLKVKRADWDQFSKLLGAARFSARDYAVEQDAAIKIEEKFDALYLQHN